MSYQAYNGAERGQARREQNKVMIVRSPARTILTVTNNIYISISRRASPFPTWCLTSYTSM